MKRIFDLFMVLVIVFIFWWLTLLIILLIKITSDGPILYWSNRIGKNNILFNSINDIVEFNSKDSLLRSPYGQGIFKSIVSDSTKLDEINLTAHVSLANTSTFIMSVCFGLS